MAGYAKDGTNRGGYRVGAGRKKKALADKILEGKAERPTAKANAGATKSAASKPGAEAGVAISAANGAAAGGAASGVTSGAAAGLLNGAADMANDAVDSANANSDAATIPPPRSFIGAEQKNMGGIENMSRQIYDSTMRWIAERGCLDAVPQGLVERYAVAAARWEQCDRVISMFGIAAKHPTTNAQIASPYVSMSLQWMKQANQQWYLIEQKVKETCGDNITGRNAYDPMEAILSGTFTPNTEG